jgi:acetolactate synthase-1/2/3 large subunit
LLATAKRPVIMAGGGIMRSGAWDGLRALVEKSGAPVTTTLMARDAIPGNHPQHLGMPGMHGTVAAVAALQKADLIVALGARFDDRVTGQLAKFAPNAAIIHADIDPAEIGKNRTADVPIVGDLKEVLAELVPALRAEHERSGLPDLAPWWHQIDQWRATYPAGYTPTADGLLAPQHVLERLGALNGPETIFVAGVGQHQMWASQFISYETPRTWINSGGLGTMGYAIPAAMGAKVGRPDATVWAIDGDGCFQMTNQELATCAINDIPIKVALINNSSLGMVRQWQTLFYDERYSNTDLHTGHGTRRVPDFVKLAEAYDAVGIRVDSPAEVDEAIKRANEIDDQVVVIDFTVSRDAMVWPMVPAGVSNDDIQYARGMSQSWDTED